MFVHETSEVTEKEKLISQKNLKFTFTKYLYCYSHQVRATVRDGECKSYPRVVEYVQTFIQKTMKDYIIWKHK